MRYWVYINEKVEGPFTEDRLVTLQGFTPETLICSEDAANSGSQEWVKASSIFEFDQVEAPADYLTNEKKHPAKQENAQSGELTTILLAKLDVLTSQLTNMQDKLDNMGVKLDESITSQQKAAQEAAARADALADQVNHISMHQPSAPVVPLPPKNVDTPADSAAATSHEQPMDMLGSIDFGTSTAETDNATSIAETMDDGDDAVALSSALNSLHAKETEVVQDEKENTFQDLLTPDQAAHLANAAAGEGTASADKQKEDLLAQFSAPSSSSEVIDQVIQEKEEEKDGPKESISHRWMSAGVAALAGAASLVGLKNKKGDGESDSAKTAQPETTPEENNAEKPSLDLTPTDGQAATLSVAQETAEESAPAPEAQTLEGLPEGETPAATAAEENAEQPAVTPAAEQNAAADNGLPSLEDGPQAQKEQPKEDTMQELIPSAAKKEENNDGNIITDADLEEAFTERSSKEDASIEQLFGLASAGAAVATGNTEENNEDEEQELPSLPGTNAEATPAQEPTQGEPAQEEPTQSVSNPNDLTEIELKEGSTYLISDFVPPASSNTDAPKPIPADNTAASEIQEKVTTDAAAPAAASATDVAESTTSEVSISKIILENTIKTKRGAALDIKTAPMVPEPAASERLHIEGMEDDLNTQHDMQSADVKPAGRTAKMIIGTLLALLLAAGIYGMLGFMNLLPAQFNFFAPQKAAVSEEDARLNEVLDSDQNTEAAATDAATQQGTDVQAMVLTEVKNYPLANGYTLEQYIASKHPAAVDLITWDISTAVDPDNYSILVKVPPENPQSFKISYRFNYNPVTKNLEPTISDAKNLLDSVGPAQQPASANPGEALVEP